MKLPVHNLKGEEIESIEADDSVFGLTPHKAAMRQALLAQLANRRSGTAQTKTRGMVRGSTIKTRNQKGGGRSRQGSIRAPHHRHGGIVFGPVQRSYHQDLPKRVRRLAIRSALSAKVEDGSLKIIDAFEVDAPKTRVVVDVLKTFGMERSVLIVTGKPARNLLLSARNIPGATTLPAPYLNVVDLLKARGVLMTVDAVREAEARWGGERVSKRLAPIPTEAGRG